MQTITLREIGDQPRETEAWNAQICVSVDPSGLAAD